MPGLVEHRQVDLGQVHHLDREVTVRLRAGGDPLSHRRADPAWAGTADDDLQQRLAHADDYRRGRGGSVRMDQARGEAPAQWRRVRRLLNEHRTVLAATAAGLYPDLPRVAGTDLLCWPGLLAATPL